MRLYTSLTTNFLFFFVVLSWGTTWFAITLEVGSVYLPLSVAYRFLLASAFLFLLVFFRKEKIRITLLTHTLIGTQGILLYGITYIFQYYAVSYLSSGVVAVLFSSLILFNMMNSRIFLGKGVNKRTIFCALLSIFGIATVFIGDIFSIKNIGQAWIGITLSILASITASIANILSVILQRRKLTVLQLNAFSMLYGAIFVLVLALPFSPKNTHFFDVSVKYVGSLFYLAIVGTALGFGAYMTLLNRVGPIKSAYVTTLFPIVALIISYFFEGYNFSVTAVIGILFILSGNLCVQASTK